MIKVLDINCPITEGTLYKGQHDAIISVALWQRVQDQLHSNNSGKRKRIRTTAPLAGLLFDEEGNGFSPSHSNKKGRRYRYYVNRAILQNRTDRAGRVHRVSAPKIEGLVSNWIIELLKDEQALKSRIVQLRPETSTSALASYLSTAKDMADRIQKNDLGLLQSIIKRIDITTSCIRVNYQEQALMAELGIKDVNAATHSVVIETEIKKRNSEDKLIIASDFTRKDLPLIKMLVQAHGWVELVRSGKARTAADVAKIVGLQERYISKHIKLALLAPDIQKAILDGIQPASFTLERLKDSDHTLDWGAQLRMFRL